MKIEIITNKELITLYLQCNLHIIKYPLLVVRLTLELQHYLRPLYKRFKQVIVSVWVGVRKYVGTKWLWGPERWDKNKMRAMDNDCYQSIVCSIAFLRVVTQRFSPALRDSTKNDCETGYAENGSVHFQHGSFFQKRNILKCSSEMWIVSHWQWNNVLFLRRRFLLFR